MLPRVDLIFGTVLSFFVVLTVLAFNSAEEVAESRRLEKHTRTVLETFESFLSYVVDVETGSRGYAITGREEFLAPVETGRQASIAAMDSLRALLIRESNQRDRLDTLNLLLKQKLDFCDHVITMREEIGIDTTVEYITAGEGRRVMDSIRHIVARAVESEMSLLSRRSEETSQRRAIRATYFVGLIVLGLGISILAYIIIRKNMATLLANKKVQEELIGELSYQNKQLDDFAHITSHNVRGPTSNINTLLSMLNNTSSLDEYQLIFSKVEKVSQNLSETLNELLSIMNVKKDRGIQKSRLSFKEIFDKENDSLQGEILSSNAVIQYDFSKAPSVEYPKVYLESIAHNLLSNALKYRSPDRDPVIQVRTEQQNGYIFLHVTDNGLGIDMERYGDRLFGLRNTFHEHKEARGVGLFMTKAQIEALGGRISVESESGKGSTFTVQFGLSAAATT